MTLVVNRMLSLEADLGNPAGFFHSANVCPCSLGIVSQP